jgi:predicted Zn-ribbon and HTH transcriptional regulator
MLQMMCRLCLRRWDGERVDHRSTCPRCGGALATR